MKRCLNCQYVFESGSWQCPTCKYEPPEANGFLQFAPELDLSDTGFDPSVFEKLFLLESKNFWFRARNRLITWAIDKYFSESTSYLEIGCGTGFVLTSVCERFPGMASAGSEIHSAGLGFAQTRSSGTPLWQMDARNIPFMDEFDLVGAFDVLEHIKEDELVLAQMIRAVRPGGGILITVPQHPFLWSSADELACHERRYTRSELKQKVINAGFEVVLTTSFVTALLPFMALSRLKGRSSGGGQDDELSLPASLNSLFEAIMNFESYLVRAGLSLPVGGSLMMAARRPD